MTAPARCDLGLEGEIDITSSADLKENHATGDRFPEKNCRWIQKVRLNLGVTAVQSLIWQPRSRKSRPTVYRSERSPGRLGAWYARWALRVFRSRPMWRRCGRARPPRARMIDKYNQAFQEDVREILLELESARLELNERRDDPKLVALMEPVPKIPTG